MCRGRHGKEASGYVSIGCSHPVTLQRAALVRIGQRNRQDFGLGCLQGGGTHEPVGTLKLDTSLPLYH
jgi:hypothetical protein